MTARTLSFKHGLTGDRIPLCVGRGAGEQTLQNDQHLGKQVAHLFLPEEPIGFEGFHVGTRKKLPAMLTIRITTSG
jgi:hypothetical protein